MPEVVHSLRMGTHAEKQYLDRGRMFYDELVFNANLVEASKSALAVFVATLARPFSIDPVTYAFALDPRLIMSQRKRSGALEVKSTFAKLATAYGLPSSVLGVRPLGPDDIDDIAESFAGGVVAYQRKTLRRALDSDAAFLSSPIAAGLAAPSRILAPYFVEDFVTGWSPTNLLLLGFVDSDALAMCAYDSRRARQENVVNLANQFAEQQHDVVIWPTDFDEHRSDTDELRRYAYLVGRLAASGRSPRAAYGGFFALLLAFRGLVGLTHGVGYGDKRDLEPVVGGGLPPARFYLPAVRDLVSISDLVLLASGLTDGEFLSEVCDCTICRGLLSRGGVGGLVASLTETEDRTSSSRRVVAVSTPRVYSLTRFHFLEARAREVSIFGRLLPSRMW